MKLSPDYNNDFHVLHRVDLGAIKNQAAILVPCVKLYAVAISMKCF